MTEEEIKRIKDELHALYQKALIKEEYEKAVELTGKSIVTLGASRESPDTIVATVLDGLWSEYYLLLKFPEIIEDEALENNDCFIEKVESLLNQVVESTNRAELLYLASVAWSRLLGDQENAESCNLVLQDLISSGKVSVALILKGINSRGIKEMTVKNWLEAEKIFSEIDPFYVLTLKEEENLLPTANILNNRGASLIRGNIDPVLGAIFLLDAVGFYSRLDSPPAKHFQGLVNRLQESLDKLLFKESAMATPVKEIIALIEEAKKLLQSVSDEIQQGRTTRKYLDSLIYNIENIREKISNLKTLKQ